MAMLYWLLPIGSFALVGFTYFWYGKFAALIALAFYATGFVTHKHRAAVGGAYYRKAEGFWESLRAWFGA